MFGMNRPARAGGRRAPGAFAAAFSNALVTALAASATGCGGAQSGDGVALEPAQSLEALERWSPGIEAAPVPALVDPDALATVLVFLDVECPVANAMAPELERLRQSFEPAGFAFRHVYPDATRDRPSIDAHAAEYGLGAVAVHDPEHRLVERFGATISPEVAVIDAGDLLYRGRIDDRAPSLGSRRPEPARRHLEEALEAIRAGGRPDPDRTVAVGCHLADLPRSEAQR